MSSFYDRSLSNLVNATLTICQPYAELIIRGDKPIENRNWATRFRGPLQIHAGLNKRWWDEGYALDPDKVDWGAIIGQVDMIDCVKLERIGEKYPHLVDHRHANGPWCWIFDKPVRYAEPIKIKGQQGLWSFQDPAALRHAAGNAGGKE